MASDDENAYGTIWTMHSSQSEVTHPSRNPSDAPGPDESTRPNDELQNSNDSEYVEVIITRTPESDLLPKSSAFQPALSLEDYDGIDVYSVNGSPSTFDSGTLPIVHRAFKSREPLSISSPLAAIRGDRTDVALSSTKPPAVSDDCGLKSGFQSDSKTENSNESETGYEEVGALLRGTTFNAYNTVLFVSAADWTVTPILDFSSSCFQRAYLGDSNTKDKHRSVFRRGYSALADAVMQHRLEMANPGGVLVRVQRDDLQTHVAIVELFGALYCVGCNRATARIHRAFRCGDQLMELNGSDAACRSLNAFHEALKSGPSEATVRIRRTPFAKSFIVRIGPDDNLAACLKPGSPTIRTVPFQSPMGRAALNPRAEPCICTYNSLVSPASGCVARWRISEINQRPVHLFATRRDVEPLLRFPPALLHSQIHSLNNKSKRSQFDTLPGRGRADSESLLRQVELTSQEAPRKIAPHRSVSVSAAALSSMQSLSTASISFTSSNDSFEHKDSTSVIRGAARSESQPGRVLDIALVVQPYCLIKNFKKQVSKSKHLRSILDAL